MPAGSFLKGFKRHEPYLGLDIGTTSLKVVSIKRAVGEKSLALQSYGILETFGYLERTNSALQSSNLKPLETEIATYLRLLLRRLPVHLTNAVVSIPTFSAFTTLIEVPAASETEIENIIKYQAQQYVPLPLASVTLDWIKVGERMDTGGTRKVQVLLMSVVNEQIERYRGILKSAGLKLLGVEIEGVSLARALTHDTKEPTLIVDIGGRSTCISVAQAGLLRATNQVDFSGGSLSQAIATGLTISPRRSEDLKRERGLLGSGGEHELSTLIEPILDVIINEATRVKEQYERTYQQSITRVLLAGGGSNLLGLDEYMTKAIGVPVARGNPFAQVALPKAIAGVAPQLGSILSVAVGLSLKELL